MKKYLFIVLLVIFISKLKSDEIVIYSTESAQYSANDCCTLNTLTNQNDDGQVIFVSKINESKNIFSRLNKKFESSLIVSFNASETNRGQFLINNKESVQFITTNDDYVNYKLYFNVLSKNCYLIDYFTPIENFVKFQPIMESSVSTIIIK